MPRYVVGISGASGTILAIRLLEALAERDAEIHLVLTPSALYTAGYELGKEWSSPNRFVAALPSPVQKAIRLHALQDMGCVIASGSYRMEGMAVVPCSMATVAAVSVGLADTVLRRAADVALKEKWPLVLVPREAPLSPLHLENLLKLSRLGAVIVPPVPAWYTKPQSLEEVERFIVGKVLEGLGIDNHTLYPRWQGTSA